MARASDPQVVILIGSDSDLPIVEGTTKILDEFDVSWELHVSSAHRTHERTARLVRKYDKAGTAVFIAAAGGAAHLPGVVAALTRKPVIGIPIDATGMGGIDALLSIAQMPPGVAVATVGVGRFGSRNAALLAIQMLAIGTPALDKRLAAYRSDQADKVVERDKAQRRSRGRS